MEERVVYRVVCIATIAVYLAASCTSASESNGTAAKDIDGKFLLKMGRTLKKPMLTLIGMAVRNLQSRRPCDDWTKWSECGAIRAGYISTRKRTKKCKVKSVSSDIENESTTVETDIGICEGLCPREYNMTTNGFCTKLYVNGKVFDDAVKQCQDDGGQLINIDSELKYGDVKGVLQGLSNHVFIGGHRKDANSPWLLGDGSQKQFFKWASGEPDSNLCMIMHYSNSYWYDMTCTSKYPYLCEITY